jgi:hypothetical protein
LLHLFPSSQPFAANVTKGVHGAKEKKRALAAAGPAH